MQCVTHQSNFQTTTTEPPTGYKHGPFTTHNPHFYHHHQNNHINANFRQTVQVLKEIRISVICFVFYTQPFFLRFFFVLLPCLTSKSKRVEIKYSIFFVCDFLFSEHLYSFHFYLFAQIYTISPQFDCKHDNFPIL